MQILHYLEEKCESIADKHIPIQIPLQARWSRTKACASCVSSPAKIFVPIANLFTSAAKIISVCTGLHDCNGANAESDETD